MKSLLKELHALKNTSKVIRYSTFHKIKEGGYASGEEFLGVTVPQLRELAGKYSNLPLKIVDSLLSSNIHEEKYLAALILNEKYEKSDVKSKEKIVNFYLDNASRISGWDLVDSTASQILGDWLMDKNRSILYKLAKSNNLWERRIAIISTYYFIKNSQFKDTIKVSEILLNDKHDLIQKAVGWMLREMGKRDIAVLESFLREHYKEMPRTMLRYAIEKFSKEKRKDYLKGKI